MTVRGTPPRIPTEVRHYDVELPDVPTMLRQLANEIESDHHTYLSTIHEHTRRDNFVCGFAVVLERDPPEGVASCPYCNP